MTSLSTTQTRFLYDSARKWFTLVSTVVCPVTFVINAPFGRFAQKRDSLLSFDGRKSWIVMEIVSPLMFLYSFLTSPLSPGATISRSQKILAAAYLMHYANRAIISPLRTPSRSKAHIVVPLSGIAFNILNGSLMGAYVASAATREYLRSIGPFFYAGLALWAAGFVGNVVHDEILLDLRRKAGDKKDKERDSSSQKKNEQHYAIPYGLLYKYISYPNYFCEWIEWLGFALAASPVPRVSLRSILSVLASKDAFLSFLYGSPSSFAPTLTPPWLFLLNEIVLMFPRAYKGHQWYHERFGDSYPKERTIVVPFVL
ncbi:hypothetical protein K435DRAFT_731778 [Dendrothele bispora CBS 962.96]|uniref:3-oxo-5-alpha-steroid 4-dehydrogenase C-terminal domain-containing protein n=1 Tax=Dendrothele bispora (strain CBS 962.96) TaxID=1314807 RepID=A0A4S8LBV2_DENBC|nr:hypothetical protein K435DRAFT_731778 [Dendrothele bispora CBS 962.96]